HAAGGSRDYDGDGLRRERLRLGGGGREQKAERKRYAGPSCHDRSSCCVACGTRRNRCEDELTTGLFPMAIMAMGAKLRPLGSRDGSPVGSQSPPRGAFDSRSYYWSGQLTARQVRS